jgi:hypothetical protein
MDEANLLPSFQNNNNHGPSRFTVLTQGTGLLNLPNLPDLPKSIHKGAKSTTISHIP